MYHMGNKLWYERNLRICGSFKRRLLVTKGFQAVQPVTFLVANVGPGAFCLEPKLAQNHKHCFQVQLTLLHEHSVFWGWPGTSGAAQEQARARRARTIHAAQESEGKAPEPWTSDRVWKWHFPWIGKVHGFIGRLNWNLVLFYSWTLKFFCNSLYSAILCQPYWFFSFINFWYLNLAWDLKLQIKSDWAWYISIYQIFPLTSMVNHKYFKSF